MSWGNSGGGGDDWGRSVGEFLELVLINLRFDRAVEVRKVNWLGKSSKRELSKEKTMQKSNTQERAQWI